ADARADKRQCRDKNGELPRAPVARQHPQREAERVHESAPTLAAIAAALPPEADCRCAALSGPAARTCATTLTAVTAAPRHEGERFATCGGPAALMPVIRRSLVDPLVADEAPGGKRQAPRATRRETA